MEFELCGRNKSEAPLHPRYSPSSDRVLGVLAVTKGR